MITTWPEPERLRLPARIGAAGNTIEAIEIMAYTARNGPAIVLSHGFPEIAYSWRHQVQPLVEAGYRVIIPDQRGYGLSDAPTGIEEYDLEHLMADLIGLLDAQGIERAMFVGHDWGGAVVWALPLYYPERVAGVIGVNTPYMAFPSSTLLRSIYPDASSSYALWFQQPGIAEGVLDGRVGDVIDKLYRRMSRVQMERAFETESGRLNPFRDLDEESRQGQPLLNEQERQHYVSSFEHSGFRGGINWYRNLDRNRTLFPAIGNDPLAIPCLMITTDSDVALPPGMTDRMKSSCADLELHVLENCGHWTQQEQPDRLNSVMVDWLTRRYLD